MSSVLNAMKKIDKEPSEQVPGRGRVAPGDVEKIVFRESRGTRRHPFVYLFLPALTVFLLSLLLYLYNEQIVHNEEAAAPPVIPGAVVVPVQHAVSEDGMKRHERNISKKVPVPSPERDMKGMAAAGEASRADSSSGKKKVASGAGLQDAGTVAGEALSEAGNFSNGTKLYKIHGISWSDDPSSRIAVINSSVVHEGERVDDGLVVRIEKNSVVIKRGRTLYNVPF